MCENGILCTRMRTLTSPSGEPACDLLPFTHPFVDPVITATLSARTQFPFALLLLVLAERGTEEQ